MKRKKRILKIPLITLTSIALPQPAYAMHISEGILPGKWAILWFTLSLPFLLYGIIRLKSLSKEDISIKPILGLMGAAVFVISAMPIPVPTAGTCSHPTGTGMSAILIGPILSAFVASIALLIQALFLAHGGLSTWGANVFSMGVMGSFSAYFVFKTLRKFKVHMNVSAFLAGIIADWATYLTTSFELASGIKGNEPFMPLFKKIVIAFLPTQLPLGILEGAMTAGMVVLLYKKRPDILLKLNVLRAEEVVT